MQEKTLVRSINYLPMQRHTFSCFKKVLGLVFFNEAFSRIIKHNKTNFLSSSLYFMMFSSARKCKVVYGLSKPYAWTRHHDSLSENMALTAHILGTSLLCLFFHLLCYAAVLKFLTYYAQYYAHVKMICA